MNNMRRVGALVLALGTMLSGLVVAAETKPVVLATPAANVSDVQVPIYKSRVLTTRTAVKRISVGNPEIADILITSPTQLYLLGRSLGSTNVGPRPSLTLPSLAGASMLRKKAANE